ncbi:hypothetical protein EGM70_09975 [Enterobacteriaceae bacterium 89]|nr:hypothetical protein [Enterobacteriaceae bacterium 89]
MDFRPLLPSVRSLFRGPVIFWLTLLLTGCERANAPSFSLLGSYFPSWLACFFVGVIVAIIFRVLMVKAGLDDYLPARIVVYACMALFVAFTLLLLFVR